MEILGIISFLIFVYALPISLLLIWNKEKP